MRKLTRKMGGYKGKDYKIELSGILLSTPKKYYTLLKEFSPIQIIGVGKTPFWNIQYFLSGIKDKEMTHKSKYCNK